MSCNVKETQKAMPPSTGSSSGDAQEQNPPGQDLKRKALCSFSSVMTQSFEGSPIKTFKSEKTEEELEAERLAKENEIDEKYDAIMAKRAKDRKNFRIAARRALGCSRMTKRRKWQKKVYSVVVEDDDEEMENEKPITKVEVKKEEE